MANNRMWLIHRPSKLGIMLGKRMGGGWYSPPDEKLVQQFYNYTNNEILEGSDDFILAMENCRYSSCFNNWVYTEEKINGFRVFKFT